MGVLTVYLDRINHLKDKDFLGRTDPYVTFHLEKDRILFDKGYGTKRSTTKPNDCNPEWGETFKFEGVSSMKDMKLHVKIWDEDTGKDDCDGHCEVDLENVDFGSEPVEFEKVVDTKGLFSRKARIYFTLKYSDDE